MPTRLAIVPTEESNFTIPVSFFDEDENAITPKTGTWTLSDKRGTIINSREDVAISSLSTKIYITLSGDDLAITDSTGVARVLTVKITYDSSYGNDLPLNQEATFSLEDLVNVSV